MNYIGVKIVVIALAFLFYWFVIRKLSKNLRRGSRVEMFSVGGRKQPMCGSRSSSAEAPSGRLKCSRYFS